MDRFSLLNYQRFFAKDSAVFINYEKVVAWTSINENADANMTVVLFLNK
jgi:hypothetical protein